MVLKTLKKLTNTYELISSTFTHGKDTYIKLTQLPGATFTSYSSILDPDFLSNSSPTAITVLLIDALLKDEGHSREDYSREDLHKRFHTTAKQFRKGTKELLIFHALPDIVGDTLVSP